MRAINAIPLVCEAEPGVRVGLRPPADHRVWRGQLSSSRCSRFSTLCRSRAGVEEAPLHHARQRVQEPVGRSLVSASRQAGRAGVPAARGPSGPTRRDRVRRRARPRERSRVMPASAEPTATVEVSRTAGSSTTCSSHTRNTPEWVSCSARKSAEPDAKLAGGADSSEPVAELPDVLGALARQRQQEIELAVEVLVERSPRPGRLTDDHVDARVVVAARRQETRARHRGCRARWRTPRRSGWRIARLVAANPASPRTLAAACARLRPSVMLWSRTASNADGVSGNTISWATTARLSTAASSVSPVARVCR